MRDSHREGTLPLAIACSGRSICGSTVVLRRPERGEDMTTIERSILIEAPVKDVFSYLEDPAHLPEIWPSMVKIEDVEPLAKGGYHYHWHYKMAGKHFEGDSETVEFEPERHWLQKATGEISSTFDYRFTPQNGSTRVEVKTEYEMPTSLLGKLAEPFVRKLNEREADAFMANLKDRLEA